MSLFRSILLSCRRKPSVGSSEDSEERVAFRVTPEDVEQLKDFYDHMYVPYVSQTLAAAVIMPYESMRAAGRGLRACPGDAGGRSDRGNADFLFASGASIVDSGMRDANRDFVRDGAIGVISLLAPASSGEGICQSESRPVASVPSGWGPAAQEEAGDEAFAYWPGVVRYPNLEDSKATRALLEKTPLIVERDGRLYGLVLTGVSSGSPARIGNGWTGSFSWKDCRGFKSSRSGDRAT